MTKTIVVTGASRGIGFETSLTLAEQGNRVIAVARSEKLLGKLEEEFPEHIKAYAGDLTDHEFIIQLKDVIASYYGHLDILINNAGLLIKKPFADLMREDWQAMLDINVMTPVELTRMLLPHFEPGGHIVNISSMGGFQGSIKFPGLAGYSVAKGALSILSECLSAELSNQQIKVNALCLGAVQTEMVEKAFPGFVAPVTAKEMGKYVADFALNGSAYYNGRILPVTLGDPE